MNPGEIKRIRKISQRQEKKVAEDLGAQMQANSGATKHGGADARKTRELRIECKFTENKSYNLRLADLEKVQLQALKGGLEEALMQVNFRSRKTGVSKSYAIIPWNDYLVLKEEEE